MEVYLFKKLNEKKEKYTFKLIYMSCLQEELA